MDDPPVSATLYDRLGGRRRLAVLVRNFYSTLRVDPVLGPIFAAHVADWPMHHARLTEFWTLQTGGPAAAYDGRLIAAHGPLDLRAEHFERWLTQWRRSCALHFPGPEGAELVTLAERLGARMRVSLAAPGETEPPKPHAD